MPFTRSPARTLMAAAATAAAAVSVAASPASAWPAGGFTATLEQNLSFSWSLLGTTSTATCTSSNLAGSITSGGAITIDTADFGGCTGAATSITALPLSSPSAKTTVSSLFWSWNLTPTSGNYYDGIVSVTGFRVAFQLNAPSNITCIYTHPFSGRYYHGDNPYRPYHSWPYLQFHFPGVNVPKSTSGSNFLCPATAKITGVFLVPGIT